MPSTEFPKQELKDALWGDHEDYVVLKNEMIDKSRWSIHYELVFKHRGKYYRTVYSRGATEYQDEAPWEYDGNLISCDEVRQVKKTVIDYETV